MFVYFMSMVTNCVVTDFLVRGEGARTGHQKVTASSLLIAYKHTSALYIGMLHHIGDYDWSNFVLCVLWLQNNLLQWNVIWTCTSLLGLGQYFFIGEPHTYSAPYVFWHYFWHVFLKALWRQIENFTKVFKTAVLFLVMRAGVFVCG